MKIQNKVEVRDKYCRQKMALINFSKEGKHISQFFKGNILSTPTSPKVVLKNTHGWTEVITFLFREHFYIYNTLEGK